MDKAIGKSNYLKLIDHVIKNIYKKSNISYEMKNILISTEFFLNLQSWGPANSVKSFVNVLKSKYGVYIITSAKDLNQKSNMELIKINNWIKKRYQYNLRRFNVKVFLIF